MDRRSCILGSLLAALAALTPAGSASTNSAQRGAEYLVSKQLPSGAFFADDRPADGTGEILASLVAGGVQGRAIELGLRHLRSEGPERARVKAAYAARIAMGLKASSQDPRSFAGFDYVGAIYAFYDGSVGSFDRHSVYGHSLSMLGISSSGEKPPALAIDYLKKNQCATGGYSHTAGCTLPADTDTTALAINALVAAGLPVEDAAVSAARDFLSLTQRNDGGFALEPHKPTDRTNANSTGLALSAIAALGEGPTASRWVKGSSDPLVALTSLQSPEGGFRLYANDSAINDYATIQAIPGVALEAYPIMPLSIAGESGTTGGATQAPMVDPEVPRSDGTTIPALSESSPSRSGPTEPHEEPLFRARSATMIGGTQEDRAVLNIALCAFLVTICLHLTALVLDKVSVFQR